MRMNAAFTMDAWPAAEVDNDVALPRAVAGEGLITDFGNVSDFTRCHVIGASSCVTHGVSAAIQ